MAKSPRKPSQPGLDPPALAKEVLRRLKKVFGAAETPLHYRHPHELAIAVILSAQCTDEMVNKVTPALFAEFSTVRDFYTKPLARLEKLIYSTGFYKNKAKNIREFARLLNERYDGVIPRDLKELVGLPGIGRKTANVISQELYGANQGVVVDTHVGRISRLLGLTQHKDAVKVERDLVEIVPKKAWREWSLYLIFLGRKWCTAKKRLCDECVLNDICPSSDVIRKGSD